jgi:hypothetical protein
MSRELIIRPEAEADIALAFGWYEARVSGLGSEFLLVLTLLSIQLSEIPISIREFTNEFAAH